MEDPPPRRWTKTKLRRSGRGPLTSFNQLASLRLLKPECGVKTHALEPELVHGTEVMLPGCLTGTVGGQVEPRSTSCANEVSRQQQNSLV